MRPLHRTVILDRILTTRMPKVSETPRTDPGFVFCSKEALGQGELT